MPRIQLVVEDNSGNSVVTNNATAAAFIKSGGTASQFLKADGSVDTNAYITSSAIGNGTLTLAVAGSGLSGSASFTANQSGAATFTVTSNATSSNNASTLVFRDATGSFNAGIITATLVGNASTATAWQTARTITIGSTGKSVDGSGNASWSLAEIGAAATVHTHGIADITDATRWWNNSGENHTTRTQFDPTVASYGFGWRFVQGATNGPGTGGSQFYSLYVGLGNDYPATGATSYGMYLAIDRNVTVPYLSIRYNESNVLSSWRKIAAGRADFWTTARTLTIGNTGKSVDGSTNVSWSLAEIGAQAALGFTPENSANKGVANGYASLDGAGKVPTAQLPSYVDDVLEYANLAGFPATGETAKIYVAIDTNKAYRWTGSVYVEISSSPGTTDSVTEGSTNLYYTDARARAAISLTTTGSSGAATYSSATGVLNIPNVTLVGLGGQASNVNLTGLSSLTYTSPGFVRMSAAGTFALDTSTYALTNQTMFIGTTSVAINRASALLSLTGVSIDGNAGTVTNGLYTTSDQTITGQKTFPSAIANRPIVPGGIIALATGDADADIWGISEQYYPSNPTTADAWGIRWNATNNEIQFVGAGSNRVIIDLDQGNLTAAAFIRSGGTASQFLKADGTVDANTYLTGNQSITLSGDATGSGTTSIAVTLANSGVTAGTYTKVTVDAKGRVTTGTTLTAGDIPALSYLPLTGGTLSGQFVSGRANDVNTGFGQIYLNGAAGNRIDFNTSGVAAPAFTTRSAGTKIVLYPNVGASTVDYAIGIEGSTTWFSIPAGSGYQFKWYAATTAIATLTGLGALSLSSTLTASQIIRSGGTASQFLKADGSVDSSTYLTGNQSISVTGDASGSGTTAIALTLATVNTNVGTFNNVTVNGKGLVTAASNVSYLTGNQSISISGDASGSGTTAITLTLATVNSNVGTFNNVTVNAKGLVTAASNVSYLTSYTETDTLSSVTGRGNTTTTRIGVATSAALDFVTAGNTGTWIGGITDSTTGWTISTNGIGFKSDNTTYAAIAIASANGLLYFARTATAVGTMNSWLEVNSSGVANFKLARPQHNGSNLALFSEIPTNLNQLTNGPGYTTNTGTVTSVAMTVPTGLTVSGTPITTSGTLAITLTAGYSIPTTTSQTNWDTAYTHSQATTGSVHGSTTVGGNLLRLTNPSAVTFLRVNADNTVSALDAATFRTAIGAGTSSTTGTVTSVAALTIGTTGTDITSSVANGTTTPVITLNIPDASASARGVVTTGAQTFAGAKTFTSLMNFPNLTGQKIAFVDINNNLNTITAFSYSADVNNLSLIFGDGARDAQFKFNYGVSKGGDFTSQRIGVDQLSFGFNNNANFDGTANTNSGRGLYFYDRVDSVYMGSFSSAAFYVGPTNANYGLKVLRPNASVAGVTIKATGQVQFNTYTSSTAFTGTAVANLAVDSSGNIITVAAGGSGTVTSVALSLPAIFTVTGSPVTTSGTLTATLASQTANTFLAAPDAAAGAPTFRTILSTDIPNLDASKIAAGQLTVQRGGTGAATLTGVLIGNGISAFSAVEGTVASQLFRRNASNTAYEFFTHDFASTAGATFTGQIISTRGNSTTTGGGQIYLNGSGGNRIDFAASANGTPTYTNRSPATKIVFAPTLSGSALDYAVGIGTNIFWLSIPGSAQEFRVYSGPSTIAFRVTGAGTAFANAFSGTSITLDGQAEVSNGGYFTLHSGAIGSSNAVYTSAITTAYRWDWNNTGISANWVWSANTAARTYTLPNASGTIPISVNGQTADASGNITISTGSIADGDKGDITVSASGATWTIDNGVVTVAKISATGTPSSTTFLRGDGTWATPSGGGGGGYTVTSQTANYTETATSGTKIILCNTTSGAFTVTLPTAVGNTATLVVKKTAGTNILTVDGAGSETIDGGLTAELYEAQESITLISDNTNWLII